MLDKRLKKIFDLCPRCDVMADIGTDHGHLPVELIKQGKVNRAIACDISAPSLKKAEFSARFSGLSSKIETRLGSGLDKIGKDEVQCVVIAGMGGLLIADILKTAYEKIGNEVFILQPMTSACELRRELSENGFCIYDEDMAEEGGKLYNIICVRKGEMLDYDFENGSKLLKKRHPLLKIQLEQKCSKLERIIEQIMSSNPDNSDIFELKNKLNDYKSVLERW